MPTWQRAWSSHLAREMLLSLYSLTCEPHMVASSSANDHHHYVARGGQELVQSCMLPAASTWARAATSPWTSLPRSSNSELDAALLSMGVDAEVGCERRRGSQLVAAVASWRGATEAACSETARPPVACACGSTSAASSKAARRCTCALGIGGEQLGGPRLSCKACRRRAWLAAQGGRRVKCKDIFCIYPFAIPRLMRLW
jgi:hypothetical protein